MSFRVVMLAGSLTLIVASLVGCLVPRSTIPIGARSIARPETGGATLIVFLHGRGGAPDDFEKGRFPRIASDAGVKAGMLLVDAHQGYYDDHTILTRLREDIVVPARTRGLKVWLVGVSMGATGALMYAKHHPGEIEGVLAIAPFLGSGSEIREIIDAGGLDAWSPGDRGAIFPWEVWAWLKGDPGTAGSGPRVYIGFGAEDRFARALPLLAGVVPKERLLTTDGGHTWRAWGQIWKEFLAREGPGLL